MNMDDIETTNYENMIDLDSLSTGFAEAAACETGSRALEEIEPHITGSFEYVPSENLLSDVAAQAPTASPLAVTEAAASDAEVPPAVESVSPTELDSAHDFFHEAPGSSHTGIETGVAAADLGASETDKEENLVIDLGEIARMIPNKMAFKIGEVAEITGLKTYVLRYWESEFEALNPQKSAFNQRMYSRRDVETVLLIKKLLYEEKFSIAGAKKKLKEVRRELKSEKHIVEVQNRVEIAIERVAELVEEIALLKRLFI